MIKCEGAGCSIYHTITLVSSWRHSKAWPTLTDKRAFIVQAVAPCADPLILALIDIWNITKMESFVT